VFLYSMESVLFEVPKHRVPDALGPKIGQRSYEAESYTA
jgi:hypothetical protein